MKQSHAVWLKILGCAFVVVAVMCVVFALILANVNGEDGADGVNGIDGVTISDITKTSESNSDTYTIYFSDDTSYSFTVTNGEDGVYIQSIAKTATSGSVDTYTITLTDGSTQTFKVTNGTDGAKGDTGAQGVTGATGAGISNITVYNGYIYFTLTDSTQNTTAIPDSSGNYYAYGFKLYCTHNWVASTSLTSIAATCTSTGVNYYECDICGAVKTEIVDTKGHTYTTLMTNSEYDCYHTMYCSECKSFITEEHTYNNGTVCDVCGMASLLTFELSSDSTYYTVTGYTVDSNVTTDHVIIPSIYNGKPVTAIAEGAFSTNGGSIAYISVPDSVTTIGAGAFSGCSSLTTITLPFVGGSASATTASASTLFGYIFGTASYSNSTSTTQEMTSGSATYYLPSDLTTVTITGAGNGTILDTAFSCCNLIKTVVLGEGVTTIGGYAFYYCSSLVNLTIPSSVTTIGEAAFYYCTGLTSLALNEGLETIGEHAFQGCGITEVNIPESVKEVGIYAFYNCKSLKSVYITNLSAWCNIDFSNNGSSVAYYAGTNPLYYNGNLYLNGVLVTDLVIPDDVSAIKAQAFMGGTFTSVTLSSSVTSIGMYAFYNCASLQKVTTDSGLTEIGYVAFSYCTALQEVNISVSVTQISQYAFYQCTSLSTINVAEGNNAYRADDNVLYTKDGTELIVYAAAKTDTSFTINETVTTISDYAFYGSTNLISLTIGSRVTSIGAVAFGNCTSLSTINVAEGNNAYKAVDNVLYTIDGTELIVYAAAKLDTSFTINETVTTISNYAFYGCTSLTSVTIGSSVTSIGNYAFYGCTGLTTITIPASVTQIGAYAFYGCSVLTSVTFETTSGWKRTSSSAYSGGSNVTVSNATTAATYLKTTYTGYYWYRSE